MDPSEDPYTYFVYNDDYFSFVSPGPLFVSHPHKLCTHCYLFLRVDEFLINVRNDFVERVVDLYTIIEDPNFLMVPSHGPIKCKSFHY